MKHKASRIRALEREVERLRKLVEVPDPKPIQMQPLVLTTSGFATGVRGPGNEGWTWTADFGGGGGGGFDPPDEGGGSDGVREPRVIPPSSGGTSAMISLVPALEEFQVESRSQIAYALGLKVG